MHNKVTSLYMKKRKKIEQRGKREQKEEKTKQNW